MMNPYLQKFVKDNFSLPGKSLDLGAGQFIDVSELKKLGWDADGVDLSTGVDLEKPFIASNGPFDMVYSNYVLQKIKNHSQFIRNMADNLTQGGRIFIHTFDVSDEQTATGIKESYLYSLLEHTGFEDIQMNIFPLYDTDHKHWHKILQATAKKKKVSA